MYDADLKGKRDSAFQLEGEILEWNRLGALDVNVNSLLSPPKGSTENGETSPEPNENRSELKP